MEEQRKEEKVFREKLSDRIRRGFLLCLLRHKAMKPLEMAEYARQNTRFYRRLYGENKAGDFKKLPIVKKLMVNNISPYDMLSQSLRDRVIIYGETTGSTGSPTPSFYTEKEFAGAYLLSLISPYNRKLRETLKENRSCINGLVLEFTIAGASFGNLMVRNGGLVANLGARSTIGLPPRIARAIVRLKPSIIAATPLDFLSLMRIVKDDYPDKYDEVVENLKILLSTAEPCSDSRVSNIQEYFGITHINTYATVEGFFTLTCPCGKKHILPAYYVEVFDENLNLIGETGKGRICITNLVKRSTPFVRYLLDDLVTITETDPCAYGFSKNIIPHGRYELSVRVKENIYNVVDFEEVIFKYGLFGDYLITVSDSSVEVEIEEYGEYDITGLPEEISMMFGSPCKIKIHPFGTLTPYRELRKVKSILKITDKRSISSQEVPEFL